MTKECLDLSPKFFNWISEYSYDQGCVEGQTCSTGKYCGNDDDFRGLTFAECGQKAEISNSFAFAYRSTGAKYCRLCDVAEYGNIRDYSDWGVYVRGRK